VATAGDLLPHLAGARGRRRRRAARGTVTGVAKDALAGAVRCHLRLEAPDGRVVAEPPPLMTAALESAHRARRYSVIAEKDASCVAPWWGPWAGAGAAPIRAGSKAALDLDVVARQLEAARPASSRASAASTYGITQQAIETQPGGENNPLKQVMLQAPGVWQDSFGQSTSERARRTCSIASTASSAGGRQLLRPEPESPHPRSAPARLHSPARSGRNRARTWWMSTSTSVRLSPSYYAGADG